MKILILGATGYIGRKLLPEILKLGHSVRCLIRDPIKINNSEIEIIKGDAGSKRDLTLAMEGIDCVYYLIHSMASSTKEFETLDSKIANNVVKTAATAKVKRIIYLGALGKKESTQSPHLKSRHQVADILKSSKIPLTEFRAAVVVGNGSTSFQMIKYLVNRLPIMVCPKWIKLKTQPIYIDDAIYYLINCLSKPQTINTVIDIGGPDILSYLEMMKIVAQELNLKRLIFTVPVLTPKLSSHWVNLVTPLSSYLASSLIESVRSETICENNVAKSMFNHYPLKFREAVRLSLNQKE
jgi:uncharacterized protein YbjT (DUF2867 family)